MTAPSRVTDAALVIVDISGYTRFVQQRPVSLQHAEAIVTELMESIIDRATSPLIVNKLEGDAALLYVETQGDRRAATGSVLAQVVEFFAAFANSLVRIASERRHCTCDACADIESLELKAFLHVGEIIVKKVRQFEEIAGEPVIMVHRMTKNSLPLHRYVLMTETFHVESGKVVGNAGEQRETIDGVSVALRWCEADALRHCVSTQMRSPVSDRAPAPTPRARRASVFHHLPEAADADVNASWWSRLLRRVRGA